MRVYPKVRQPGYRERYGRVTERVLKGLDLWTDDVIPDHGFVVEQAEASVALRWSRGWSREGGEVRVYLDEEGQENLVRLWQEACTAEGIDIRPRPYTLNLTRGELEFIHSNLVTAREELCFTDEEERVASDLLPAMREMLDT